MGEQVLTIEFVDGDKDGNGAIQYRFVVNEIDYYRILNIVEKELESKK